MNRETGIAIRVAVCAIILRLAADAQDNSGVCDISETRIVEPLDWTDGEAIGWSVDLHDAWAIMGSPTATGSMGAVYIFRRDDAGTPVDPTDDLWIQVQRIVSPDRQIAESFGAAVGINADWAVVGAEGDKEFGVQSGSVHVFRRDDSGTPGELADDTWLYWQKLYGDLDEGDRFGLRIALDFQWFAVSAPGDDDACPTSAQCDSGAVYVFERMENGTPEAMADDTWAMAEKLLSSDSAGDDRFGSAVAIQEPYLVVGASGKDLPGFPDAGAAYLFELRSPDACLSVGSYWSEATRFTATQPRTVGAFGLSAAFNNDRVAVASLRGPVGDRPNGEIHVFRRMELVVTKRVMWKPVGLMRAPAGEPLAIFGRALGMSGDTILVSSVSEFGPESPPSAVYLFRHRGSALDPTGDELWLHDATLVASGSSIGDYFGEGLAVHNTVALIGSPNDVRDEFQYTLHGNGYFYFLDQQCWDLVDVAEFQNCMSVDPHEQPECGAFDLARDGVIDLVDFRQMRPTFSGPR